MLKDAGEKIDWLAGQDLQWLQSEEGQRWVDYLRHLEADMPNTYNEGEYHPNDIDQLAPFLTKELRAGRFEHRPYDELEPYSVPIRELPKWAEYLRSRKGIGTRVLDHDYSWRHLLRDRRAWDAEYDDAKWQGIYTPSSLKMLEEAMAKRQRDLANPVQERRDLKPIEPSFDWPYLTSDARHDDDPETPRRIAEAGIHSKQINQMAQFAARYPDLHDKIRQHLTRYINPQTGELQNEPYYNDETLPGFEWGEARPAQPGAATEQRRQNPQEEALFTDRDNEEAPQFTQAQMNRIRNRFGEQYPNDDEYDITDPAIHEEWYHFLEGDYPDFLQEIGNPQLREPWRYASTKPHPLQHRKPHLGRRGRVCRCYYGHKGTLNREHVGHVKEAAQLDVLRKRKDLKNHPDHDLIMKYLEGPYAKYDRLLPWIVREWKNDNLIIPQHVRRAVTSFEGYQLAHKQYLQDVEFAQQHGLDDPADKHVYVNSHDVPNHRLPAYVNQAGIHLNTAIDDGLALHGSYNHHMVELGQSYSLNDDHLDAINAWYDELKRRGEAPPIDSKKMPDLEGVSNVLHERHKAQESERRKDSGEILHTFPRGPLRAGREYEDGNVGHHVDVPSQGWTMRLIRNGDEARLEGSDMDHCIGKDHYGYPAKIDAGKREAWHLSLRDPENHPHATLEVDPMSFIDRETGEKVAWNNVDAFPASRYTPVMDNTARLNQAHGPSDSEPADEYADMVRNYLEQQGVPTIRSWGENPHEGDEDEDEDDWHEEEPEFAPWWDDEYRAEGHSDPDNYIMGEPQVAPDAYYQAVDEAHESGYEPPELVDGDHDWKEMVNAQQYHYPRRERNHEQMPLPHGDYGWAYLDRPKPTFNTGTANELEKTALERGDWGNLMHEGILPWLHGRGYHQDQLPEERSDWTGDNQDQAASYWVNQIRQHTHPVTGEIEEPSYDPMTGKMVTTWDHWWNEHGHLYQPGLPGLHETPDAPNTPLPPGIQRGMTFSRIAALSAPLYYRWAFDPQDGSVTLDHNEAVHPAYVQTPSAMRDSESSEHGYAYRINGGWRLTDYEHNPVSDPFIVAQVVRTIRGEDGRRQSDGIWQFREPDYDRLHYGQPIEDK